MISIRLEILTTNGTESVPSFDNFSKRTDKFIEFRDASFAEFVCFRRFTTGVFGRENHILQGGSDVHPKRHRNPIELVQEETTVCVCTVCS